MPLYQKSSKCEHIGGVHTLSNGIGSWITRCGHCMLQGDWCTNPTVAEVSFYDHNVNWEIKSMYLPSDPHEAYAFGVKQATEPIIVSTIADAYVNETLQERRKSLLTKKITRWANVYKSGDEIKLAPKTFPTKMEAINGSGKNVRIYGDIPKIDDVRIIRIDRITQQSRKFCHVKKKIHEPNATRSIRILGSISYKSW